MNDQLNLSDGYVQFNVLKNYIVTGADDLNKSVRGTIALWFLFTLYNSA